MRVVISISGGGMRGVIPCEWLHSWEYALDRPISDCVDLFCGTSTGGILGLLAASGMPMSAAMKFYRESGPRIFRADALRKIYSAGGALHTKYRNEVLARELRVALGDRLLSEALCRVMVTSLTAYREAVMVKSWHPEWADLPMAVAALMTSSAQVYFPHCTIMHDGRETSYLDGGNVRNNPSVCALVEALRLWPGEPMRLIHLGTGKARDRKPLPNGGAAFWAAEVFDATTSGDDSYDDYQCRAMREIFPDFDYVRLDVDMEDLPALDDASPRAVESLRDAASSGVSEEWKIAHGWLSVR